MATLRGWTVCTLVHRHCHNVWAAVKTQHSTLADVADLYVGLWSFSSTFAAAEVAAQAAAAATTAAGD